MIEGIELVRNAYSKNITFYDTAPGYGNGLSEKIIGIALHDVREKVFINSKIGHLADGTSDFSVSSLESQIKTSIERLQTSYLDSVLLHNPSIDILLGKTKHFQELKRLKKLGLINFYGVSIDTYEELNAVLDNTDCEIIELLFNIFFQSPRYLFNKIKNKNIKLIIKVPLDSGWLTGKYDEHSIFTGIRSRWSKNDIIRRSKLVSSVKKITKESDLTLIALAFILSFNAVTAIIPGIKNNVQLNQNLAALDVKLSVETIAALEDLYDKQIKDNPLPW